MLTPQEVANKSFTKSMMGGYSMPAVDEFLDELTEDYTSLYKENAALKAKLKVLVEKVEEYRSTEDNMRTALFAAQKMANEIVETAKEKGATITVAAEEAAKEEIARIRENVEKERRRLSMAQEEMAQFIATWRDITARQAEFLMQLPSLPLGEEAAEPAEESSPFVEEVSTNADGIPTDSAIEATIQNILRSSAPADAEAPAADGRRVLDFSAADEEKTSAKEEKAEEDIPSAEELNELFGTRTFHLDELQFGKNYEPGK